MERREVAKTAAAPPPSTSALPVALVKLQCHHGRKCVATNNLDANGWSLVTAEAADQARLTHRWLCAACVDKENFNEQNLLFRQRIRVAAAGGGAPVGSSGEGGPR